MSSRITIAVMIWLEGKLKDGGIGIGIVIVIVAQNNLNNAFSFS